MTIQEVIEKKGKLLKQLQEAVQVEEKDFDEVKVQAIEADIKKLEDQKRAIEQAQKTLIESHEPEKKTLKEKREEVPFRDKMELFIRGKEYVDGEVRPLQAKTAEFGLAEQRAFAWNKTDATGGYLAPDLIADEIAAAQAFIGGMVTPGVCRWIRTSTGNKVEIPVVNDTSTKGAVVAEETDMTSGSAVTYAVQDLDFYKITSHIATISNELIQDAAFDVVAHVMDMQFKRLYRGLNYYFTQGTSGSHPVGINTLSTKGVDAAKRSLDNDDLLELIYSVNRAYRQGAVYMMNDTTLGVIRRLMIATTDVDERPMWQESMQAGEPMKLNGYPVIVNPDVDDIAPYDRSVFFGDFSRYWVGEALPMRLIRLDEYYKIADKIGIAVLGRWAGNLAAISGDAPIKHIRHAST